MAKAGMRRPDPTDPWAHGTEHRNTFKDPKNEVDPVPEIQGKAKTGNAKAHVKTGGENYGKR